MKISRVIFGLLFCYNIAVAQDVPQPAPASCYPCAITNVLVQFKSAIQQSVLVTKPTQREINIATARGETAQPHHVISMSRLVNFSAGIDTSKCPDDFKSAWKDMITAFAAESHRPQNAQALTDVALLLINPAVGAVHAASDIEKANAQKKAAQTSVKDAILQLRLVCASYGVK
jgi:hypothetical protein